MLGFVTVARKILTANLLQKMIFRSGILGYHYRRALTLEVYESLHTLFDKYIVFGPHAGEILTKSHGTINTKF